MDMGLVRGFVTLILMVLFLVLIRMVYKPSKKKHYEKIGYAVLEQPTQTTDGETSEL